MADQLIYLVETVTAAMRDYDPVCLSDSGLAAKLGEGFEVISTMPSKKVTIGKKVVVTPMLLRQSGAPKNALTVSGAGREQHQQRDDSQVMARDNQGGSVLSTVLSKLSAALALTGDNASHLGAARNHNMPGLTIVSGELTSKAWDLGMSAARSGQRKDTCPFPPLSEAGTKWMQGYKAGAQPDKPMDAEALHRITEDARQFALTLDEDDEITCPYTPQSEAHAAWVRGFVSGGGRVTD